MQKIEKDLLKSIKGGYDKEKCDEVEYDANHEGDNKTPEEWEEWADNYETYCV